jgi:hypothetical protein
MHRKCVACDLAVAKPQCTPLAVCQEKIDEKMFSHLNKLLNNAYYVTEHNKTFTNFENLTE